MLFFMRALAAVGMMVGILTGCAPPVSTGGFDAPDPASKVYAIESAVRSNDLAAVPHIVEQLSSDDPAVRFCAIEALERLTGETHGYLAHAPEDEREAAIARWEDAIHSGTTAHGG